jgi:hypothetical protein
MRKGDINEHRYREQNVKQTAVDNKRAHQRAKYETVASLVAERCGRCRKCDRQNANSQHRKDIRLKSVGGKSKRGVAKMVMRNKEGKIAQYIEHDAERDARAKRVERLNDENFRA